MSEVTPFHAVNESEKTAPRYHTDDTCPEARQIPRSDLRAGSAGFYLCEHCARLRTQPR